RGWPGNSRPDCQYAWCHCGEAVSNLGHVGAWPYQAHFSTEHVDNLWQFVDLKPTKVTTDAGNPRIALHGDSCARVAGLPHSPNLQDLEMLSPHSDTVLAEYSILGSLQP